MLTCAQNQTDVELGLQAAKDAGLTVFRTWGFNDKNVTYDPNGLPQYGSEGAGATDVVFQRWYSNGTSIIDISAFDKVVNAATKVGIKLIVAFTNNWADYGGMDVYTVNLGGRYHDDVSCDPSIPRGTNEMLLARTCKTPGTILTCGPSSTCCPRSRRRTRPT